MKHLRPIEEKKPKGAPDWHDSDAPDANGRFRDLSIKDLAAWLIKTRKKDVKRISGSLTQQIVFNRNDDPKYAEKMEKVRKEVYKQLGREDLLDKMDESVDMDDSMNEMSMGYDGHTGLFYIKGVPFTEERLEQVLKHLRTKVKLGDLPKQFSYFPAIQVADEAGGETVTITLDKAKQIEATLKRFKGKLAHDGDFNESVTEKREDVGKFNTVKKVIKELGRRPSEQEVATFITKNYYDVTEVERGDDDPAANDKIADLVAFYKFDIDDWNIAWFDAQNESLVTEASKDRMIKQIKRALKDGLSIFKLPMATQTYYRKNKSDFETVEEGNYKMEDIYDLIAHHRFDKDFKKLSSKDKEWVENDAKERGFNESLLESDMFNMYYSLIDELYEAKPGPDAYMTGLSDKEKEAKKAKMKKQADMEDDDPDSYEEMPGDKEARESGKVKKSKHTTAYNKKFKSESMKNLKSFDNFVTEKRSDLWSPFQKADILAGDMFGAMGLYRLQDDELDQIIDLKKADKLAKKMFGEFGFKTLAAKEMEDLLDNNPDLLRESKEDFKPHMMYDPKTGKGYKAETQEDHEKMNKLGYVHEKPEEVTEAEKYITGEFKVGDKIKTNFGEWEVIEIDYKPGKSFIAPFIFKGKDMKRVDIPNPPKTNRNAVGYKVTDGAKYPTIGFLYQYKGRLVGQDITKLATVGVDESVVNEEKIKYAKGKTYQSSGHWTVMVDSNSSMCDIRVNHSAGWRLDPHDDREETWELLDNGRQRAIVYFRRGNIDKFAQQMFDLNVETSWGNKTKLTAKDYADIIRLWIDMKKANESLVNEFGPMRGSGNRDYSTSDLADRIGELDDILMSDRKAEREWEEMSQNYLDGEKGSEYWADLGDQELQDAIDDAESLMKKYRIKESIVEASLAKIHRAAKKGSYPVSLVVIENGKVVKQELVGTPQIVPAAFNQLKKEYPNATVHVESKTGERLFSESVVNEKETLASAIEKEMDDNRFNVDVEFFTRDLRQIQNTKNHEDLHPSIKKVLKALKKKYRIKESVVTEAKRGQIMPGDYVKTQYGDIYLRVDGKVGKSDAYVRVTKGKAGKRKTGLHDSMKLTLVENRMLRKGQFRFGAKLQYGIEDVNESYGFYGTLMNQFGLDEVNELFLDGFSLLGTQYNFTDQAALYYLNSKAGRWVADQVNDKLVGPKNMSPYYGHLEEIFAEYAKKGQWRKWAKEYDQFAEEDNMEEGLMIRESKSDMDEYYRGLLEAEQTTNDQSPLGDDGMETGIKNKAKESGVPVGLLRIIMRRGLAAWKTGHRPGATQAQWGYARVNSFLTKQPGTWGKADSDIAKKVRDGGHDKNL